jgi:putative FmdB family regulatory protein
MPLYEYRCEACQHDFELLVRESTVLECPECHSQSLEKQLSVFAVAAGGGRPATRGAGPGPCGSCGHPDGPGSCSIN